MRSITLVLLLVLFLQAAETSFTKEISLKKDQYQQIVVKEEADIRVLNFRWTLYAGDGLVMHLNYNGMPHQFILFKNYKKDTYKVRLLPKISAYRREPYLYLIFKKYDFENKKAIFEIFVDDPEKRALIEVKESK